MRTDVDKLKLGADVSLQKRTLRYLPPSQPCLVCSWICTRLYGFEIESFYKRKPGESKRLVEVIDGQQTVPRLCLKLF